jgi:hypothetical protein
MTTTKSFSRFTFENNGSISEPEFNVYGWNQSATRNDHRVFIESFALVEDLYEKYLKIQDRTGCSKQSQMKELGNPFSPMRTIKLAGKTCELNTLSSVSHNSAYPYVLLNGFPISTIAFNRDLPLEGSIEKAEKVVKDFLLSDSKYCFIEDNGIKFDLSLVSKNKNLIETYDSYGKKHLSIEGKTESGVDYSFLIFDIELCEQILKVHFDGKEASTDKFFASDFWGIDFKSKES